MGTHGHKQEPARTNLNSCHCLRLQRSGCPAREDGALNYTAKHTADPGDGTLKEDPGDGGAVAGPMAVLGQQGESAGW